MCRGRESCFDGWVTPSPPQACLTRHEFDEMRNKSQNHDHFLVEPLILLLRRSGLVNSGGLNPSALRFACSKRSFLISLIRSEERQSGSDDQPN